MLQTPFRFPDGDSYPIYILATESGGLRLSDRGHTLMHLSYEHDVDVLIEGAGKMQLERIMAESGLQWEGGAFCLDTAPEQLLEAAFQFGQGLTGICQLAALPRPEAKHAFADTA